MIPIMIVACSNDEGLLGIDTFKVDTTKLINFIKEYKIGLLKGYKANVPLKESHLPRYGESRKSLIHTYGRG